MSKSLLFLFILSFFSTAFAVKEKRSVSFEWEAIPGARSYEVQISRAKKDAKDFVFKSTEPVFSGSLKPGQYKMKLRSVDNRGVPGLWSPESPFLVPLDSVRLVSPPPQAKLLSENAKDHEVKFSWKPVAGAKAYLLEISSSDDKIHISEKTKSTEYEKTLPAATQFTWKVKALGEEDLESESTSVAEVTIQGKKLEKPKLSAPENEFVRTLTWTRPDFTEAYDLSLSRYNKSSRKWEPVQKTENQKEENLSFDEKWTGGKYRFSVRAKANLRSPSDVASLTFDVKGGDRSPAAEYVATVRESIDRVSGWYAIASYLVTQMNYSLNYRDNSASNFSATGGTGRLGLGWFSKDRPWGFLSILDMSGFLNSGKVSTFASLEASGVYKKDITDRSELRALAGIFYKELPQVIPVVTTDASGNLIDAGGTTTSSYAALGPQAGVEYWYSLTQKLGLQANAHLYYSALKITTPSGENIKPQLSTQYGFLGSYRVRKNLTGLGGVSYREDNASYSDSKQFFANGNTTTSMKLKGLYLNFYAEYSF